MIVCKLRTLVSRQKDAFRPSIMTHIRATRSEATARSALSQYSSLRSSLSKITNIISSAGTFFGHPLPFDRHDWTVQSPNGSTQRYVIDYYVDETKANTAKNSGMVSKDDKTSIQSIMVDVRPALLDSFEGVWSGVIGRGVLMPLARRMGKSHVSERSD